MWFVDHAQVIVTAGAGGRGCTAFAQPPYIRYPFPDGGDGGDGGDVIVEADPNIATLLDFHFRHHFKSGRGGHGSGNQKTGKRGEDLVIRVPVGTVLQDAASGSVLRDLARPGGRVIIANGGRGGRGNASSNAGRGGAGVARDGEATPGGRGQECRITLELKLIADVGLTGFPNAGKSSLLARISTAHPKIAAYPFTTRYPVLGVVQVPHRGSFVACDIPGLIEGAHEGKGLGFQFLRHVERTRVLAHLVDLASVDGRDPVEAFRQMNHELSAYSAALAAKPQLIVANKMDLPQAREQLASFQQAIGRPVWPISTVTGEGIPALLQALADLLQSAEPAATS